VKQKEFPIENNALDTLEWFSLPKNAKKQHNPEVL
jgi:hypothetical protein